MVDREQLSKRLNEAYQLLLDKGGIHSKTDLAKAVNKDRAAISNALANKGRVMTEGLMNRVADAFPDILNREYLINGTGSIALPDKKSRPHIADMQAAAGFLDGISEPQYATNRELAQMVPDYDFTIRNKKRRHPLLPHRLRPILYTPEPHLRLRHSRRSPRKTTNPCRTRTTTPALTQSKVPRHHTPHRNPPGYRHRRRHPPFHNPSLPQLTTCRLNMKERYPPLTPNKKAT